MFRVALLACVGLGACGRVGFEPDGGDERIGPAQWADDRYAFRKAIELAAPALPPLVEFPALVVIDDPDLTRARPDGRDLAFVFEGRAIPHEVEAFDAPRGSLVAWVRVPMLSTGARLEIYFGSQELLAPVDASAVWQDQVAAVWHLHQSPSGPPPQMIDSTTALGGIAAPGITSRAGVAAAAIEILGTNQTVEIGDIARLDFGTSSFSYSTWVFVDAPRGLYDAPLFKGGANFDVPGYDFQLGSTAWSANLADGGKSIGVDVGPAAMFMSRWVHLVAVIDRATDELRGYVDGVLRGTVSIAGLGSLDSTYPLRLGNTLTSAQYRGGIDEVRIYARALSEAWIATEHANYSDPTAFVRVGAIEQRE